MLNLGSAEPNRAGFDEIAHPHPPKLIMHWIDARTAPAAHKLIHAEPVAAHPVIHHDQLIAEWIEQSATLPRNAI